MRRFVRKRLPVLVTGDVRNSGPGDGARWRVVAVVRRPGAALSAECGSERPGETGVRSVLVSADAAGRWGPSHSARRRVRQPARLAAARPCPVDLGTPGRGDIPSGLPCVWRTRAAGPQLDLLLGEAVPSAQGPGADASVCLGDLRGKRTVISTGPQKCA